MAITASVQSALQDLSWDETIVPTLRKRLESESRAISKRLSTVSFGPGEDGTLQCTQKSIPGKPGASSRAGGRVTPSSMNTERPSGIPRPSLNYSRPSIGSAALVTSQTGNRNDVKKPIQQRSRTYSQPYVADAAEASSKANVNASRTNGYPNSSTTRTANALPTPVSSRSNSPVLPPSPALEARDARNAKTSGSKRAGQAGQSTNRNMQAQNKYDSSERWDADEDTFDVSYPSIHVDLSVHGKQNGILHEAPPFSANSSFVSEADERPSLEERPYEHWYRGDLSRNGGVGELRIGNRKEMLEIASYGHKLRTIRHDTLTRQRRRAESTGHRESVIFADEPVNLSTPMVLDEAPLTDMEEDTEADTDREQSMTRRDEESIEQPKRNETSGAQPVSTAAVPATPKRRQPVQLPRSTPNALRTTQRTASEPLHAKSLSSSTSSTTASSSRSPTNGARLPISQSQSVASPAQKRGRAKSPAITPRSKKPRPSAAQQKRSKSTGAADRLRTIDPSEYPEMPDGPGNMADAIPSWTQPKRAGNWDDVVLPAVARKMGLEDQYEEADGSPKTRRPSSEVIAPQPGTFGFDPSKRRLRYDPATGEEIPMEELERPGKNENEGEEATLTKDIETDHAKRRVSKRFSKMNAAPSSAVDGNAFRQPVRRYSPPPSPAPFVHYHSPSTAKPEPIHEPVVEEEKHGGCCGCTIM